MGIYVVVANQFKEFSKQGHVLSYDELLKALNGQGEVSLRGVKIIAGQGLDVAEVEEAYHLAVCRGFTEEFEYWRMWTDVPPAGRSLSHKCKPENILISIPEETEEGLFVSDLLIHAENELMLDHLTGQHVQGMVLAEACRQMFLAVSERFHLDDYQPTKRYFVLNEMNVRYTAFTFPLPAQIRYRLIERNLPRPDRVDMHAEMEVWQGKSSVTAMTVKFTVMDAERLGAQEASLAARAVSTQVRSLRRSLGIAPAGSEPIQQVV